MQLVELDHPGSRWRRYLKNLRKTLEVLGALGRSDVVIVQVPSIVLGWVALAMRSLKGFSIIIDAHNAVIEGAEGKSRLPTVLYSKVVRSADRVIVTNDRLAARVRALGGRPVVLADPVPPITRTSDRSAREGIRVVAISTWADDEPLGELIGAAELLPPGIDVVVTGRPKGPWVAAAQESKRVVVSGFLTEEDYIKLLSSARAIVDLTTREDCLVCGSYEALALGVPMVLSDTAALRDLVGDAAVYCANVADEIAKAIVACVDQHDALAANCAARCGYHKALWRSQADGLLEEVSQLIAAGQSSRF